MRDNPRDPYGPYSVCGPAGESIAEAINHEDEACLIASAPEMYEALKDIESKIVDFEAGRINWRPEDFLARVRIALSKASGKDPVNP